VPVPHLSHLSHHNSTYGRLRLVHWVTDSGDRSSANTLLAVTSRCQPTPEFYILSASILEDPRGRYVKLTDLLSIGENGTGNTRNGSGARLVARDLVASNDEGGGSCKLRDLGRTVAAALSAPCRDGVVHGVLVAIDEQVLEGACDSDGALVVGAADSRHWKDVC